MSGFARPLVSIVIPTYNHGLFLDEAIRSVLTQDYPCLELVVLDDGSTDDTRERLRCYSGAFHWETHPNMGQARTLNKGWRLSQGTFLAYLSADDRLEPGAVSAAVEVLASNPEVVLTYCDFVLLDQGSRVLRRVQAPELDYARMLSRLACPIGPGAFFRRWAFEAAGPWNPDLRQMPDVEFWLRLGLVGRFARIPRVLAGFRTHPASQTHRAGDEARAAEPLRIAQEILAHPRLPAALRARRQAVLSQAHLVSGQLHLRAGRHRLGWGQLALAVRAHPGQLLRLETWRRLRNGVLGPALMRMRWRLSGWAGRAALP